MALCYRRGWKTPFFFAIIIFFILPFLMWDRRVKQKGESKYADRSLVQQKKKSLAIKEKARDLKASSSKNLQKKRKFEKLVYIKISKTGSTTLHTIFDSYGYIRKIPLLIPRTDGEGFNPRELRPGMSWDIAPNRKYPPKISAAHARYHQKFFDRHFGDKTAYVTSIREPVSWFISHVDFKNRITHKETAHDILQSDKLFYKGSNAVYQIDREYHNYFLDWLGFYLPPNYVYNETEVLNYIKLVDKKFHLVMIMEHFPESLVLLKRTLQWSIGDIFYTHLNSAPYKSGSKLTEAEKEKFLDADHNRGDHLLYQHFNRTFWKKIAESAGFHEEVEVFKGLNSQAVEFCNSKALAANRSLTLTLSTRWEPQITVNDERCLSLSNRLYKVLHKTYAPFFGSVYVEDLNLGKYKNAGPWPGLS